MHSERKILSAIQQHQSSNIGPRIEIVEQPAKSVRFRYECEGRSTGYIPGVNSTPKNKTFPAIRIAGYKGRAVVVVSCVTKDRPYRPHPHKLVGKTYCKDGVCSAPISLENMTASFDKLGIQCIKRKDIEEALQKREQMRVDPFRTGFDHKRQSSTIDLNSMRLCFQVFIEGAIEGKFNVPLEPVVSDPIYDKKATSDLVISRISDSKASVAGGKELVLLCEKVVKDDIQIRFFEERDGKIVWEGFGHFQSVHVHKQVAISFTTPSYRSQQVDRPIQVHIQLRRPSDGATSETLPFVLEPSLTGATSKLVIHELSHSSASVAGGKQVVLLCEKVSEDDVQVRFFEEINGHIVWEGFGEFKATHKEVAISFKTPSYRLQQVDRPVQVHIQLRRPSDGATSEALPFELRPSLSEYPDSLKRRRQNDSSSGDTWSQLQEDKKQQGWFNPMAQNEFKMKPTESVNHRLPAFGKPVGPPSIFPVDNMNSNMSALRSLPARGYTQSPMECSFYNLPPAQPLENMNNPFQAVKTEISPCILDQNPMAMNRNGGDNAFDLGNANVIQNIMDNLCHVPNGTQQSADFDFKLLDSIDFNSLSISDIDEKPETGDVTAGVNTKDSNMSDSLTRIVRNTMQDLTSLNNMYKPKREEEILIDI